MGVETDGSDLGTHRLVPLAVFMPWATIGSDVTTALSVTVATPPGTSILSPHRFVDAYEHLNDQDIMKKTSMLVVPTLESNNNGRPTFQCSWRSLPPTATSLMLWLAMPATTAAAAAATNTTASASGNFNFVKVDVAKELTEADGSRGAGSATLLVPGPEDKAALTVPLPGFGPPSGLYRMCVRVPFLKPSRMPGQQHRVVIHLTISDASASTGLLQTAAGVVTVRDRLNELAILRFRKRLAAIPALLEAGVLSPDDVWVDAFFAFNHRVQEKFWLVFRVGDHAQHTTLHDRRKVASHAAFDLRVPNASQFVTRVEAIRPYGGTMFEAAADGVLASYTAMMKAASSCVTTNLTAAAPTSLPRVSTFVAFDTDGGDNDTLYVDKLREVVKRYNVVSGVVTGFGSWLNQHSATTIASLLDERIPPLLALTIPTLGTEGSNRIFRQSFIAWLDAVRIVPVTLAISAGAIKCEHPRSGELDLNALDVFAVEARSGRRARIRFGLFDISDPTFTATNITGCVGGDDILLYIASRQSHLELAQTLRVLVNDEAIRASLEPESQVGDVLGHTWLTLMAQQRDEAVVINRNFCVRTLMTRLEEDLSFRLQLPTLSGSTSYLGRANTQQGRPPIDALHTPTPPDLATRLLKLSLSRGKPVKTLFAGPAEDPKVSSPVRRHWGWPSTTQTPQPSTSTASSTFTALGSGSALFGASSTPTAARGFAVGSSGSLFGGSIFGGSMAATASCMRSVGWDKGGAEPWGQLLARSDYARCGRLDDETAGRTVYAQLSKLRLANKDAMPYTCKICSKSLVPGASYMHCKDCVDYDECGSCTISVFSHSSQHPLHTVVARVTGPVATGSATAGSSGGVLVRTGESAGGSGGNLALAVGGGDTGAGGAVLVNAGASSSETGGRVTLTAPLQPSPPLSHTIEDVSLSSMEELMLNMYGGGSLSEQQANNVNNNSAPTFAAQPSDGAVVATAPPQLSTPLRPMIAGGPVANMGELMINLHSGEGLSEQQANIIFNTAPSSPTEQHANNIINTAPTCAAQPSDGAVGEALAEDELVLRVIGRVATTPDQPSPPLRDMIDGGPVSSMQERMINLFGSAGLSEKEANNIINTAPTFAAQPSDGAVGEARADDALATKLLGPAPSSTDTATSEQPDRTITSAHDRLRHLFAVLLEWWPLVRLQCGTAYLAQLPEVLDPSVVADMTRALEVKSAGDDKSVGDDKTLSQVGLTIADTLMPLLKPR
jgi:hypothetical protein